MLEDFQLERIFSELALPNATRALIGGARTEVPPRRTNFYYHNANVWFYSQKMGGRHLRLESRTLGAPAAALYEAESDVLEYWPRALKADLLLRDAEGNTITRRQHVPDFLVLRSNGIAAIEWRKESRLLKNAANSPQFHKDAHGKWHFRAAEEYFSQLGFAYELHSAFELPRKLLDNVHFLNDYHDPRCAALHPDVSRRLTDLLLQRGSVPFLDLLNEHGYSADDVFKAIVKKAVYVDLHCVRLDVSDELIIHRDAALGRAYQLLSQRNDASALPYPGMANLAPGTIVQRSRG